MKDGISNAELVIIAVGTPPHPITKEADMKYIHAAATELAEHLTRYTIIATKSTVPVGTGDDIEILIAKKNPQAEFDVVSLPEFCVKDMPCMIFSILTELLSVPTPIKRKKKSKSSIKLLTMKFPCFL